MLSSKEMPNSSRRDSSLKYDCPTVDSSFESSELSNSSDSNNEYQYFTFRKNTPSRLSFTQNTTNCADDISFVHQISPCSSLNQLEDDDYGGDEYFNDKEEKLSNASAYPSGRMPLIQVAQTRQTQGQEEKSEEDIMEIASDNMSWLSKAFCILPTSSTLDTVQDTCYNEAVTKETFDDEVCFMSDERDDVIETTTTRDLEERVSAPFEDAHRIEVVNTIEEANPPRDEEGVSSSSCENMYNGLFQHELITCHSWHNWREEEEVQFTERSVSPEFPTRISKHPHNRSTNPSSRKNKIKNLSFNLTPFDHGGYESNEDECILPNQKYKPIDMKRKIVSFPTKMRKAKADPTTADHKSVKGCEWQLNVINSCGAFGQSEEEVEDVHSNDFYDDDDLGYDSDPNEILQNFAGETRNSNNHRHKLPMSLIPYNIEEGNIDEGEAFHMVCEHMAAKRLLVWHKESNKTHSDPPVAINAWLEYGSQLYSSLLQPKFCWQEAQNVQTHDKCISNKIFTHHTIELLDISKIVPLDECNNVDRNRVHFVKRRRSFIIEVFGGEQEFVFEARTEMERDNIVDGLKMIVARLSSKIIVGDSTVLHEFFSPTGSVPGGVQFLLHHD